MRAAASILAFLTPGLAAPNRVAPAGVAPAPAPSVAAAGNAAPGNATAGIAAAGIAAAGIAAAGIATAGIAASAVATAGIAAPGYAARGVAAAGVAAPGADVAQDHARDVAAALERLRAPTSGERAGAAQWLARHLEPRDRDALARAILAGEAETGRRIAEALADDERHVGLAVDLARGPEERVAAVGREALVETIARWSRGWTRPPIPRPQVLAKLQGKVEARLVVDPRARDARPDLALDRIARFSRGSPPLVLDPDLALATHPRETSEAIEGSLERVLDELARVHRADLVGFAFDDDLEGRARPWVLLRRSVDGELSGAAARVIGWCLEIAGKGEPARRSACARALAATGWPAGIAWLESRWIEGRDEAALDGVLLAAGRGQVAPALARPDEQRALYDLARSGIAIGAAPVRADASGGLGSIARADAVARADANVRADAAARADAIARALAAAGPRGLRGENLSDVALEGWAALAPRERWLRLVVLEGQAVAPASGLEAVLGEPFASLPPPLALQALRACSALGGRPVPALVDPGPLLAWAAREGRLDECAGLLRAIGVRPPPRPPRDASDEAHLAFVEWTLFAGDTADAAREIAGILGEGRARSEALAARGRTWIREGAEPRLLEVVAAARALDPAHPERFDDLVALSGAGDDAARSRALGRALAAPRGRGSLLVLGALAAGARGGESRAALLGSLRAAGDPGDRLDALDRAVAELRAARDEKEEAGFVEAVRQAAREAPPDLRASLRVEVWPVRPGPPTLRLFDLDRSLETAGF